MLRLSDELYFLIKQGVIAFLMMVMTLKTFIYQTKTEIMILSDFFQNCLLLIDKEGVKNYTKNVIDYIF
ncbi:hypothetical protein Sez_0044 [Streptococcus equi subsp. zooepidemicus MGCS10565]|uniref:Uncharacterized protein n=2 Tax=Streptococcus equi TaxID=1336 RepID=B4U4Y8_STREM|nr:hypothetical protein Sez_0044 [Streptococcus equi subsp. zooepidemicus MGCS10565]KIQ75435.1 hypothetical protein QQ41_07885 [Streptococcus equi subsp. zooepidemicus]